ncbi:MAG TPA: zf-HC2 domain-containing protein [Candidatus Cybelea sp.]|nr:zf-HC2 domain-containing protein [Candidatus Cybelea sp.]
MSEIHPTPDELVDYLHGELPAARSAAIAAHIAGCPECADARDAEISLTQLLRAHARAQERELPPGVVAGIWEKARSHPPSVWERLSAALRPAIAVPVAIAIAAFLFFSIKVAHGPAHAATIDAGYYVENHATLDAATPLSEDDPIPQTLANDAATR